MIRYLTTLALLFVCVAFPFTSRAQDQLEGAAAPKPKKQPTAPKVITDPAVLTIVETTAKTPIEQFEQVLMLLQLDQAELAKPRLQKLIDANLDVETLATIANKFGTSALLQFAQSKDLTPEASQFANAALEAADKITHDSGRLAALVKQLSDADRVKQEDAIISLARAHGFAIAPLFVALADGTRADEHAAARAMILRLEGDAIEPLMGMLESPDAATQALAAELLGQLEAKNAITVLAALYAAPHAAPQVKQAVGFALQRLAGTLPSMDEVHILLEREARRELDYAKLVAATDNYGGSAPTAEIWHWNTTTGQSMPVVETTTAIALARAAHWSRVLYELDPKSESRRRLFLIASLEDAKFRAGIDQPLPTDKGSAVDEATSLGVMAIDDLLYHAIASGSFVTATAAAEILGRIGSPDMLVRPDGRRSPLAEAARSGDRRLRFAAIDAILKLAPQTPFAGAGDVAQSLKYFGSTSGFKRALVAHPKVSIGRQIAAYLGALGYETDIATNGRNAFEFAVASPDYELAIVHVAIDKMRADDLLAQLRKDPRTASLPVVVLAIPNYEQSAERLAHGVPLTAAFAEPQDAAAVKYDVERLLSMPGCAPVPVETRQQQAAVAIDWLLKYSEYPVGWLDVRSISPAIERALYVPGLVSRVAVLLGNAGTPAGQQALVDLARRGGLPFPTRELAAIEFARSVHDHGILLTTGEISEQYNRFNDNAGQNKDTHKVLTIILDAIESKTEDAAVNAAE